ncbi:hypothetical protein [Faecalibacter sp. LW9]|uniref:hypothetical protein n=1 Tax=Faecalibacter sp. LW9 TaxID=3103144 RepID=UPI002AFFEB0A|nr:hypothetical protein [Faecalibacter sp. LW9]
MLTIHFPDLNIYKYFPEHLDECDEAQYILLSRLAYAQQSGKITFEQFRTLAVYGLLDIKKSEKELDQETSEEVWANIARLSEYIDNLFIISEDKTQYRLNTDYLNNKIEKFSHFKTNYYGPADPLNGICFGQWIDAVELVMEHYNQPSDETYTRLLAIMFLKRNEEYPTKNIEQFLGKRTKHFKYIDKGIQYGFFMFFTSFMNYLNSANVEIAGNEIDLSIIFDSTSTSNSTLASIGIRSTAYSIAQSGEFGDYEKVRQMPLGEIMLRLYEMKKAYLDEKQELENNK